MEMWMIWNVVESGELGTWEREEGGVGEWGWELEFSLFEREGRN